MIKVVVIANCQAVPISRYIQQLSNEVEVIEAGVVLFLNDSKRDYFQKKFEEADYIIAQQINSNYPCQFVTTESLLKDYSSKVISIVNLFFSGYNPELRYIRMAEKGVLRGPLEDYHIHAIIDGYKAGLSVPETVALYSDFDYNEKRYKNSIHNSLDELRSRDSRTELQISDYIQDNLSKSKLFHTMNHPSEELLIKYSQMSTIVILQKWKRQKA